MTDVTCTFQASQIQGNPIGSIVLKDCNPSIANTETLGGMDVIIIVAILVALGLVGQYVLHHINRQALTKVWQTDPNT